LASNVLKLSSSAQPRSEGKRRLHSNGGYSGSATNALILHGVAKNALGLVADSRKENKATDARKRPR
jgi:hypothetical protein